MGGADSKAVHIYSADNVTADAALFAISLELEGSTLTLVAKGKVMTADDPADVQLLNNIGCKFLPWHLHDVLVKVDENHIINTVAAADYLLAAGGAVDKGHIYTENQIVRMHVKAQH